MGEWSKGMMIVKITLSLQNTIILSHDKDSICILIGRPSFCVADKTEEVERIANFVYRMLNVQDSVAHSNSTKDAINDLFASIHEQLAKIERQIGHGNR